MDWMRLFHVLCLLTLLTPRVGQAMPGDMGDVVKAHDCPGTEQLTVSAHLASDLLQGAQKPVSQAPGPDTCSADCLLSCGLSGLQAGLPGLVPQVEPVPDSHPVPLLDLCDPTQRPGTLFRPPRP